MRNGEVKSATRRRHGGCWRFALGASLVLGCSRTPDASERARIAQWQSMVAAAREEHALAALRNRARQGVVAAQSALGQGLAPQVNPALRTEGLAWLKRAAAASDAPALFTLGKLEWQGLVMPRDEVAARDHLIQAASLQDARADYYLALMDKNGIGRTAPDFAAAAVHLERASHADIPAAQFLLANAYRDGSGVKKDEVRALELYRKAADKDHPEAIQTLALAYRDGGLGLRPDPEQYRLASAELADALKHAPPLP